MKKSMRKHVRKRPAKVLEHSIVSLLLVTQNDEQHIDAALSVLEDELAFFSHYEIIIVDNGSTDQTLRHLRTIQKRNQHVRILMLSKSYDIEVALTAGLDSSVGDYITMLNMYTDPPHIIRLFVKELTQGNDIVYGRWESFKQFKIGLPSRLLLTVVKTVSRHEFFYRNNYSIGLSRRAVNALMRIKRKKRYFEYLGSLIGFPKKTLLYKPIAKYKSRIRPERFLDTLFRVLDVSISSSIKPLRIVTLTGIAASFLNVLFISYVFLVILFKRNIAEGWVTTSLMMGTMFFLLFTILTVVSEYIVRVLFETRDEPLYFVADEVDSATFIIDKNELNIV